MRSAHNAVACHLSEQLAGGKDYAQLSVVKVSPARTALTCTSACPASWCCACSDASDNSRTLCTNQVRTFLDTFSLHRLQRLMMGGGNGEELEPES